MRVDQRLVALGLARSRSQAQGLIKAGAVLCDGMVVRRASQTAPEGAVLSLEPTIAAEELRYVSRGALKLAYALDAFELSPRGAVAMDLGASTGGFTQVLLERGAAAVYAVDVGHGQLAADLAADPRVRAHEGVNVKALTTVEIAEPPRFMTADLSFISLLKALPTPLSLLAPRAALVVLVKPQFEVGREKIGKGGVVRDAAAQAEALASVRALLVASGWRIRGATQSPILGGDGNLEYLVGAERG